ncbi:MAG: hypothetical protein ACTSUR_00555 [Candidatus Heimdallarchaeaceae archaeon]
MKINKRFQILLLVILLSVPFMKASSLPQDESVKTSSNNALIILRLYDASYGDFDNDAIKDDIQCFLEISFSDGLNRKNFICDIHLTLPDGEVYSYSILVSTVLNYISFELLFINHAYLPGDYTIKTEINLFTNGYFYDSAELIIDPPSEEVPDDDPYMTFTVI